MDPIDIKYLFTEWFWSHTHVGNRVFIIWNNDNLATHILPTHICITRLSELISSYGIHTIKTPLLIIRKFVPNAMFTWWYGAHYFKLPGDFVETILNGVV